MKTFIKELIIVLLLCLAIILILGILLYEYVPMSKTIPTPVSYTTPQSVKQELATAGGVDESQVIMTYSVDSTDLNNYKRIQDYKPGKANPFSSYETTGTNTTQANSGNGSSNTNSGTSGNNENGNNQVSNGESSTSGGQYFQDKGTK